jgi:hypothetical protein
MVNREKSTNVEEAVKVYDRLYEDSKNKDKFALHQQESTDTLRTNSITKTKRFKGISRGSSA